jgi:hypothetical protein
MAGNRRRGIVVQQRDRHLLSELGVMRIIDREAAKIVAGFRSTRRANARLLQLTRAGLLRQFFIGSVAHGRKAVYTLSRKGADLVNASNGGIQRPFGRLVVRDTFVEHRSGINEIYLAVKYRPDLRVEATLRRWHSFHQPISEAARVKPDGYFELASRDNVRGMFVEVDLGTEALTVWQQMASLYVQLAVTGEFRKRFGLPQFRVLIIANSEKRLQNIRSVVAKATDRIFWFATIESIHRDGFWSPIWLRPVGDQRQPLL